MAFESALYRLRIAHGFLEESRQDVELGRWRSAVDNAQLAVENSAKAVLSLAAPVGKTHNPAPQLRETLSKGYFSADIAEKIERLAECAEKLGFDVHIQTDYGDETGMRTPRVTGFSRASCQGAARTAIECAPSPSRTKTAQRAESQKMA